jgi:radical SAM superfamily enzyme YgiQ (UPF0313 family)|tara:strand:- start:576 stop:2108 length:1533 start_codon:yes stop_codon:yes gene_type:complete
MKILFIISDIFLSAPLGIMQLSAMCKKHSYKTRLATLRRHDILEIVNSFQPDIIAYSAMSADIHRFKEMDREILSYLHNMNRCTLRIMGGPHATYFTEILKEMNLDAICIGEGDNAIVQIIKNYKEGGGFEDIPNVLCHSNYENGLQNKELINDLDSLPFADNDSIFDAVPYYRTVQLRSFLTSRGCPYKCSYCHNDGFNKEFKGLGPIVRRCSVDRVIDEIKYTREKYPPVKIIRFADDTFVHKVDSWLESFVERYKSEIGIPFYCLMRSNVFSDEMARLLKEAGCVSLSMSVEHGDERIRNTVLKRGLTDEKIIKSFEIARKYGIRVQANAMLGIPGTTIDDDLKTFHFLRSLKMYLPTIGIFSPFPGTELTEYALKLGSFAPSSDIGMHYQSKSLLTNYTDKEKSIMVNIMNLGFIFAILPESFEGIFKLLIKLPSNTVYSFLSKTFWSFRYSGIFPKMIPFKPLFIFRVYLDSKSYFNVNSSKRKSNAGVNINDSKTDKGTIEAIQ